MLDTLAAEALKLRHHKATWYLIGLYPVGFIAVFLLAATVGTSTGRPEWFDDTTLIWSIPRQSPGRYLISAFIAVVFAGEYDWNTWKLIVPHRARTTLIAAKYAMTLILFLVAFTLTAGIAILASWAEDVLTGDNPLGGLTANALLQAHAQGALAALAPLLLTIAYTSLAAVLTRVTMAALVISMVVATVEQLIFSLGPRMSLIFPSAIWDLYHLLPGYHLANLAQWIREGAALRVAFPSGAIVELPWAASLAVAAGYIGAFAAATLVVFRRQDIN